MVFKVLEYLMLRLARPPASVSRLWTTRHFASTLESEADKEKIAAARDWLQRFNAETIPRNIGDVTFSRSSGPGGQNVNKSVQAWIVFMSNCPDSHVESTQRLL